MFAKYWTAFAGHSKRVHFHWLFDFQLEEGAILLIDEADAVMFKEALYFYENYCAKNIVIVGFTATPYDTSNGGNGIDKKLLDELEFDLLYQDPALKNAKQDAFDFHNTLEHKCDESLAIYIKQSLLQRPAVMYCAQEFKPLMVNAGIKLLDL
jgi:hypothetical protein